MTSGPYPANRRIPPSDFISIAPAVAERFLGEPSSRSAREWRWRRKGFIYISCVSKQISWYRSVSQRFLQVYLPRGAEFGHIEYLLKYIPKFRDKSDLRQIVSMSRKLRNEIAHYRLVSFAYFERLWREMERLELV